MKTADAGLIQREKDLIQIVAKDPSLYHDTSLAALTVYSLFWLHQWQLRRTIEAVSVLNWRLFPDKFGMVGWSDYPDAFRTNRSLLQGQPKYRNWLTGAASTGFSLNERGIEIAHDLIAKLGPPENKTRALAFQERVFNSGDVLLSHGLSPYYHRGCSVSLPCSEWERVGPLRDSHQKSAPIFGAGFWCVTGDPLNRYNGCRLCLPFNLLTL